MGGNKLFKRTVAVFLAVSTILAQTGVSSTPGLLTLKAKAASGSYVSTEYVVNGDFETQDLTGWSVNEALDTTTDLLVEADAYATGNPTYAAAFKDTIAEGTAISISQEITLPAGTYYISAVNQGAEAASFLTLSLGGKSVAMPATTGWNVWKTASTENDPLVLTETSTVTVSLTGTALAGYWGSIDNVMIYQWQDAPEYSFADLTALLAKVPTDYQTMGFTAGSVSAVTDAAAAARDLTESSNAADIAAAYENLNAALGALIFDADIFVEKIENYDEENSIRGVDVSSYITLMDSFDSINASIANEDDKLGFRDWDGKLMSRQEFFDFLAASGVNYIRTRVWNNPYDQEGNGYGGGNNDMAKAIEIGTYATHAGMKNLIDFHFSDFWADPAKQKAPKAWTDYSLEAKAQAISTYVTDSLTALNNAGVDVGMVQIGNETNGKFCGSLAWSEMNVLFDAGCDAVHNFNDANGTNMLTVLHFTNPEASGRQTGYAANLADYDGDGDGTKEGVSYDVFASSYYPYWHGTLSNLTSVLNTIASTHDKYVMVAETSWATTLEDGDGHENTVRAGNNDTGNDYSFTVQGQANEIREVWNAVNTIPTVLSNGDRAALGAFYWEPAWIPVQVYDADNADSADILNTNKLLWEKYGSGWASSYASEYDPEDAGAWYGGSAVDNQAVFDFKGTPLASVNVFKYLAYGATAPRIVDSYTIPSVDIEVGTSDIPGNLPTTITVTYNDSTTAELAVTWNEEDIQTIANAAASNNGLGNYTLRGTVPMDDTTFDVTCTVTVIAQNILADSSFESQNTDSKWTINGSGAAITNEDPRTGTYSLHFYSGNAFEFTASQTVSVTEAGSYSGYFYVQGGDASGAEFYLTAQAGGQTYTSEAASAAGWKVWQHVTLSDIKASAGDEIIFTIHATGIPAGGWGCIDDTCLYLDTPASTTTELTSNNTMISLETESYIYDGAAKEPAVTSVVVNDVTLTSNDYEVSYDQNTAAGTAVVTITGKGSYSGTVTKEFTIAKASIQGAAVTLAQDSYIYDGTAKKPAVTSVVVNGVTLTTKDYDVSYDKNTAAGTAAVIVTGKGNYTGTAAASFTIKAAPVTTTSLKGAAVTLGTSSYTYNGAAKKPKVVSVKAANGTVLTSNDYTVSYRNNVKAGTASVIITGKGKYTDSVTKTFTIKKAAKRITVKSTSISKEKGSKAFSLGAASAKGEKLSYSTSNSKVAVVNRSGKVTLKNYGIAKITIKSASSANYKAAANKTVTIKVTPKKTALTSAASKKKATMTVKWKQVSGASGYKIVYSTSKSFKKAKTITVKSSKTVTKTISKLTKGKKYYVKVCAYKTVKVGKKNQTVVGPYSKVKTVTIKKK